MAFRQASLGATVGIAAVAIMAVGMFWTSTPAPVAVAIEPEVPDIPFPARTIGTLATADSTVILINRTGLVVTAVGVRAAGNPDAAFTPVEDGLNWAPDESAGVSIVLPNQSPVVATENADERPAVLLRDQIDLQFTFADGTIRAVHNLPPESLNYASLHIDAKSDLAYLSYRDALPIAQLPTGDEVVVDGAKRPGPLGDTLEAEQAWQEAEAARQAELARQAEEARQAAIRAEEERQAAEEAEWLAAEANSYSYSSGGGGSYSQSGNQCLTPAFR